MKRFLLAFGLLFWAHISMADATLVGRHIWNEPHESFGGVSGIEVAPDGLSFIAITDRGNFLKGAIRRDQGTMTGVTMTLLTQIMNANGKPLDAKQRDSEGLAIGADGRIHVSFEGNARVSHFEDVDDPANTLAPHPDFAQLQLNSALEALAIDNEGRLYTLPERSGRADRPFPVYRHETNGWSIAFHIPRRGTFLPVGADIGPDNLFYLLERDYTGIGFRSRVRRFQLDGTHEETVLQTGNATHDNLEGISVWQDAKGALRLLLVADDNFKFFQHTEIVEYRLTP